jgi:hypothetical protein
MDAVARSVSVDPYAQRGGLVEDVARADLQQDIAAVAFGLQVGDLAGPIRTDIGWSLLRILALEPADEDRFGALQGICTRLALLENTRKLEAELARELTARHQVRVNEGTVATIVPEQGPDSRLMPRMADGDAVVATIGPRRSITASAYARALAQRWRGVRNLEAAAAAAPIILQGLIHDHLLAAEALRRGYGERPDVVRAVNAYETQTLVPRYLEQVVAAGVEVTGAEMERYYADNAELFSRPPRLRLGQITVATPMRPEPIWVARRMRCASPPESVAVARSTVR